MFNDQVIFQAYHLQYSASFIEICHFSDTALLRSSWRISPRVCQLRIGEKDFAELLSFGVLGPKRRNSTMQTYMWQHGDEAKSLESLKAKGRQH